ncbi:hypothetical protein PG993_014035 [Apiospora rasikravindrae]|uniref:Uncharacterized protein n=1 Tax=Apiospora rasikravindrae TaxID=990691 RepID=A0ABR1RRW7_9PEZI
MLSSAWMTLSTSPESTAWLSKIEVASGFRTRRTLVALDWARPTLSQIALSIWIVMALFRLRHVNQQDAGPERLHHEQPPLPEPLLAVELGAQRVPHGLVQRRPVAVDPPQDVVDDEGRLAPADVRHGVLVVPGLADPDVFAVQSDQGHPAADRVDVDSRVQLADGRVGHLQVGVGGQLRRGCFWLGAGVTKRLLGGGPHCHFGLEVLQVVVSTGLRVEVLRDRGVAGDSGVAETVGAIAAAAARLDLRDTDSGDGKLVEAGVSTNEVAGVDCAMGSLLPDAEEYETGDRSCSQISEVVDVLRDRSSAMLILSILTSCRSHWLGLGSDWSLAEAVASCSIGNNPEPCGIPGRGPNASRPAETDSGEAVLVISVGD